ncbi:MAG: hypothetical protein II838_11015 [Lachnospiraceae bacterium]|nr:hypothetical protein [Lachnospiraceae bacterium]
MKVRGKIILIVVLMIGISFETIFSNFSISNIVNTCSNKHVLAANGSETEEEIDLCELQVATDTVSLKKGSTINVNLFIKEKADTLILRLDYDSDVLEINPDDFITMDRESSGLGYGSRWCLSGLNEDIPMCVLGNYTKIEAYVCTFHFKVKEDATTTTIRMIYSNASYQGCMDMYGKDVECVIQDGGDYSHKPEPPIITSSIPHLYKDYKHKRLVSDDGIELYANGGSVKENGVTNNYKQQILFTDIRASYKYSTDKNGKLMPGIGNVIVGITSSNTKPTLNAKGKIVDAKATKIASASIKNGCITVSAKNVPGIVYLWVMDTGDASNSDDPDRVSKTYCCCPIIILSAPSAIYTYASAVTQYGEKPQYTKATLGKGENTNVYLLPVYEVDKQKRKATGATYTAIISDGLKNYVTVTEVANNHSKIIYNKQNVTKKITGTISFTCKQNGKKAVFTLTLKP